MNKASSLRIDSIGSALVSNVRQELNTAAVIMFYSHNQTSMPRSLN